MIKIEHPRHVKVIPTIFPDKTSQVWKLPQDLLDQIHKENSCVIEWHFDSEDELIHVAQLKTLLDRYTQNVKLFMPYLPYARQDKFVDNGMTFALTTFAQLINAMNFKKVSVIDAHSSHSKMINNLEDISPIDFIRKAVEATKVDLIVLPDSGANARYGHLSVGVLSIVGEKERDQATGYIKYVKFPEGQVEGKKLLIVDDLCDGGMTFKIVARSALQERAKEVHLYVSHGIFSKGLQTLRDDGIDKVFTYQGEVNG